MTVTSNSLDVRKFISLSTGRREEPVYGSDSGLLVLTVGHGCGPLYIDCEKLNQQPIQIHHRGGGPTTSPLGFDLKVLETQDSRGCCRYLPFHRDPKLVQEEEVARYGI